MVAFVARVKSSAQKLWADTDGFILPYVTIMLVVIVGVAVLAIDGARGVSLQSQLQKAADAYALAAARELDGTSATLTDLQTRITNAFARVTNSTLAGMGNANTTVQSYRLLSALPASDTASITSAYETTEPADARFIEVTVTPVTLTNILPASVFGGVNTITTGASAVAGLGQVVCDITPMYICNPFEQGGDTYDQATQRIIQALDDPASKRRLVKLRNDPGNSQLPGNFGFLQAPQTNGFNAVRDAIAKVHSPACFKQKGVDFQTGFAGNAIAPAFNVRFDAYDASMNSHRNDPDYAPAANVRKGYWSSSNNYCNASPFDNCPPDPLTQQPDHSQQCALALPNDPSTGWTQNSRGDNVLGNGNWDFEHYWSVDHPGVSIPNGWSNSASTSCVSVTSTNCYPSRYQIYQYEISLGGTLSCRGNNCTCTGTAGGLCDKSSTSTTAPTPQEVGAPRCNANAAPAGVDRRLLYVAIVNCQALGLGGGTHSNVPVASFAKTFLTRTVDGSTGEILAEMVGRVGPGTGDPEHNDSQVQLYR
jgi:Flp pilus assembly protein TadG